MHPGKALVGMDKLTGQERDKEVAGIHRQMEGTVMDIQQLVDME